MVVSAAPASVAACDRSVRHAGDVSRGRKRGGRVRVVGDPGKGHPGRSGGKNPPETHEHPLKGPLRPGTLDATPVNPAPRTRHLTPFTMEP